MTINGVSWTGTTAAEPTTRDSRVDHERAPDGFAGMFAGAVQSASPKPEPKKPEGTSELDRPEEPAEDETDDDRKVKRARVRPAANAATNAEATGDIIRSAAALDPELQAKLARVTARMKGETGHDVTVTETYRSQERQNALFAQGREAPGSVVTWTRNSKHTQGRAVDVTLDGGVAGLDAYAALQRIAAEEGLRTLGARDPGHLELQGTKPSFPIDATSLNDAHYGAASPGQVSIARLGEVAQVAQVAVARPAQVARVATVVQPTHGDVAPIARRSTDESSDAGTSDGNTGGNNGQGERGYSALAAAVALRESSPAPAASPVHTGGAASPVSPAERAAQIIATYQDAPARPVSRLTMSVDAGNGVTDTVRIAMRGTSLGAAIDAGDVRGAQAMNARADELVRALAKDGIDVESLRVRAAASTTTVASVTGGSHASQTSSDASSHSRFERNDPWQSQQRQRSQDERRQQQRNQRGGQGQ